MIRNTIFAITTVAAIGTAVLIPTAASAGGGGKGGGGMGGGYHGHGHGYWGRGFGGIMVIGDGYLGSAGYTSATESTSSVAE